ncbi:MAG: hypothetical protein HQ581_02435 [Planctomycetes bacterium]|nr:hypothetical protein [Planctomycetota bacterium]
MNKLDPMQLFERIAKDVPSDLHKHLFVTGSLAAAYHFKDQLRGRAVNTKDADLVVHPAGDVVSCRQMAQRMLDLGWSRTEKCYPRSTPEPADKLRAIRLYPPHSHDYFVEFLGLPRKDQKEPKEWVRLELQDGWYGLPSFRFLGITATRRFSSHVGLEYASPDVMALANLLSHPEVGSQRIESGYVKGVLRSAKDLGRVIAIARLAGRDETESWREQWFNSVQECFPERWRELFAKLGSGFEEMLKDDNVLEEARQTTDIGLLNGMNVSAEMLRASGERLLQDVIDPLTEKSGRRTPPS